MPSSDSDSRQDRSGDLQQQVTVETETVPSVPTLGVGAGHAMGTLRIKRSQDSVPRVASRATAKRRGPRPTQGTKADIFAAKVANAVDEQDSSGSDETFVYDTPQAHDNRDSLRRPFPRTSSSSSVVPGHPAYTTELLAPSENGYSDHEVESEEEMRSPQRDAYRKYSQSLHAHQSNHSLNTTTEMGSPRNFVVPSRSRRSLDKRTTPSPFAEYDPWDAKWPRRSRDANDSMKAKHLYFQRWRVPAHPENTEDNNEMRRDFRDVRDARDIKDVRDPRGDNRDIRDAGYQRDAREAESDERQGLLRGRPSLYNYQSSKSSYGRRAPKWSRDDPARNAAYSRRNSSYDEVPYNALDHASLATRFILFASLVLILLLSLVFVIGVLLATARPLQDFDVVSLSDVLVSDRELVFSLITCARNAGLFSVAIERGELDVFAASQHANSFFDKEELENALQNPIIEYVIEYDIEANIESDEGKEVVIRGKPPATRTVLLGTVTELESPMKFHGGFSSATQWKAATAKLVEPLGNNTKEWSAISAHEFDLTIKGVVSYSILGREHLETVSRSYHVMAPELLV